MHKSGEWRLLSSRTHSPSGRSKGWAIDVLVPRLRPHTSLTRSRNTHTEPLPRLPAPQLPAHAVARLLHLDEKALEWLKVVAQAHQCVVDLWPVLVWGMVDLDALLIGFQLSVTHFQLPGLVLCNQDVKNDMYVSQQAGECTPFPCMQSGRESRPCKPRPFAP